MASTPEETGIVQEITLFEMTKAFDRNLDGESEFSAADLHKNAILLYDENATHAVWFDLESAEDHSEPREVQGSRIVHRISINGDDNAESIAQKFMTGIFESDLGNLYDVSYFIETSATREERGVQNFGDADNHQLFLISTYPGLRNDAQMVGTGAVKFPMRVVQQGKRYYVKYYSPPAVMMRVENNIHVGNGVVTIKTIATVMDASEMRKASSSDGETYRLD